MGPDHVRVNPGAPGPVLLGTSVSKRFHPVSVTSVGRAYPGPVVGQRIDITTKVGHDDNRAKDCGVGTSDFAVWRLSTAHRERWPAPHAGHAGIPDESAGAVADLVRREVKKPPGTGGSA